MYVFGIESLSGYSIMNYMNTTRKNTNLYIVFNNCTKTNVVATFLFKKQNYVYVQKLHTIQGNNYNELVTWSSLKLMLHI